MLLALFHLNISVMKEARVKFISVIKTWLLRVPVWLMLLFLTLTGTGCHQQEDFPNDPEGNFDALWTTIDEHYTFFAYKNIDWNAIGRQYRAKITRGISSTELYDLCGEMLKELKDGHTNLITANDVSRYWIWEKHPLNYDARIIDENYLNFNYKQTSGIKYQILSNNFGYMYYGDFSVTIGAGNLDAVFGYLASSDGLIIDVRSNGGGFLTNVETLVSRFINQRTKVGSMSHKTGPGHNDFSQPYDYYFNPASGRVHYSKPVVVLCNRGSFSATNNFVSIMKRLNGVTIVGDTTGGGCGLPFTSDLPNGWSVRFSAAVIRDVDGNLTEFGVAPDVEVEMTETDRLKGKDTILETAFQLLESQKGGL